MKYFPAIQDKDKKESLNFDNQSLESKLSISTSTSTINEFQNQSTYLSGISGGKGTAMNTCQTSLLSQ